MSDIKNLTEAKRLLNVGVPREDFLSSLFISLGGWKTYNNNLKEFQNYLIKDDGNLHTNNIKLLAEAAFKLTEKDYRRDAQNERLDASKIYRKIRIVFHFAMKHNLMPERLYDKMFQEIENTYSDGIMPYAYENVLKQLKDTEPVKQSELAKDAWAHTIIELKSRVGLDVRSGELKVTQALQYNALIADTSKNFTLEKLQQRNPTFLAQLEEDNAFIRSIEAPSVATYLQQPNVSAFGEMKDGPEFFEIVRS